MGRGLERSDEPLAGPPDEAPGSGASGWRGALASARGALAHALEHAGEEAEGRAALGAVIAEIDRALGGGAIKEAHGGDGGSRAEAEEALRRSERDLRQLIERSPDGVAILRGGSFAFVNPAFAAALGTTPAEIAGRDVLELTHPDDRPALEQRMRAAEPGEGEGEGEGAPERREVRFVTQGGEAALELSPGQCVHFEGEDGVLVIARDVTERRRIQTRLVLADRLSSLGTLAAGVAHEINNPLAYVISNVAYVTEELTTLVESGAAPGSLRPPPDFDEWLDALLEAHEGAERVRQIVRDLKTFARGDDERRGPVDVRRALDGSINMANNEIRHRARLVKDYEASPAVFASEARLGQAFLNLLLNAAQSIEEGAADHNEIRISIRERDGAPGAPRSAVVEIADSGAGIRPEILGRVFDPFFTTKPVGEGTGLGLAICHAIVTAHGGSISVESKVGRGSVFRVELPTCEAAPRPAAPRARGAGARRLRVLVVDDEPHIGATVRRILAKEHDVVTTDAAREALELLDAGRTFDVVLCDVMMPEVSGMDFYLEVAKRRPDHLSRIVFVTGGAFTSRAKIFLEEVSNTCLDKPFTAEQLRALVRDRAGEL